MVADAVIEAPNRTSNPKEILMRILPFAMLIGGLMLVVGSVAIAQDTVCGPEIKDQVAKQLAEISNLPQAEQAQAKDALYKEFLFCADNQGSATEEFFAAARQCGAKVNLLGDLFYEEMSCCGYDPQRRQFGCPVKIKQTFGFGPAPLPGSREFVLNCVADPNGVFQPVAADSVHLADEMLGRNPSWQFAVIASGNQNLNLVYPMGGETRRARSILSWGFEPTDCEFQPIWGNALDYTIRLDQ